MTFSRRKQRAAIARVETGDGQPLKPYRWWQPLSRALFHITLNDEDGRQASYAVDVPYWQRLATDTGSGRAHLYLDGRHAARAKLPAAFPVPGGWIEVESTSFGLKRCHYVTPDQTEKRLDADRRSAEGLRARLESERPILSRAIAVVSVLMLLIPIVLTVPQILHEVSRVPLVADRFGVYTSPIDLPLWLNVVLGLCASTASVERATRLRSSAVIDGAA